MKLFKPTPEEQKKAALKLAKHLSQDKVLVTKSGNQIRGTKINTSKDINYFIFNYEAIVDSFTDLIAAVYREEIFLKQNNIDTEAMIEEFKQIEKEYDNFCENDAFMTEQESLDYMEKLESYKNKFSNYIK